MGFFISAMLSTRGRAYLPDTEGRGHICPRPKVEGKCALSRADNSADMKKPM